MSFENMKETSIISRLISEAENLTKKNAHLKISGSDGKVKHSK